MAKIIVDNKSSVDDEYALQVVISVMKLGFVSGERQYCWASQFNRPSVDVFTRKTRGETHSFVVVDKMDKAND